MVYRSSDLVRFSGYPESVDPVEDDEYPCEFVAKRKAGGGGTIEQVPVLGEPQPGSEERCRHRFFGPDVAVCEQLRAHREAQISALLLVDLLLTHCYQGFGNDVIRLEERSQYDWTFWGKHRPYVDVELIGVGARCFVSVDLSADLL